MSQLTGSELPVKGTYIIRWAHGTKMISSATTEQIAVELAKLHLKSVEQVNIRSWIAANPNAINTGDYFHHLTGTFKVKLMPRVSPLKLAFELAKPVDVWDILNNSNEIKQIY